MSSMIPHQLHLTRKQINKMMKGGAVNIPLSQMGSDKGDTVVMLNPANAKRMLSSFKRMKGVRLALGPDELQASVMAGRGFNIGKAFKKLGKTIKKGVNKGIGEIKDFGEDFAEKAESGIKEGARETKKGFIKAGREIKRGAESKTGRKIIRGMVDITSDLVIPAVSASLGAMAGVDPEAMGELGSMGGDYLQAYARKKGYGMMNKMKKGTEEMRERMARIRAMRGSGRMKPAVMPPMDLGVPMEGKGFYKTLKKMTGINKSDVVKGAKALGREVSKNASKVVGDAVAISTGSSMAGRRVEKVINKVADTAIKTESASKTLKALGNASVKQIKRAGAELADDWVDKNLTGAERSVAQKALAGKYKNAKDLIYDYADEKTQPNPELLALGGAIYMDGPFKRMRGRPKKGTGAMMSGPFKKAMKMNLSGLELNNVSSSNTPISKFKTDSRVKPAGDLPTFSPYQGVNSPAMNPFIPKTYTQEGGMNAGYGGSGLYGPSGRGLY